MALSGRSIVGELGKLFKASGCFFLLFGVPYNYFTDLRRRIMQRTLTLAKLSASQTLLKVRDKYGITWVKVSEDSWLSQELTFATDKFLSQRRPAEVK